MSPSDNRPVPDGLTPSEVFYTEKRPWGSFTVLLEQPGYKVKEIEVLPGHRLSLQQHTHREEHWVLVQGEHEITLGKVTQRYPQGSYVHIPQATQHRVANPGKTPIRFIEVQQGSYLGEDDITRFEDDYQRVTGP